MEPPKKIYLQWLDEDGEYLDPNNNEVTWCQDRINGSDIEYVLQTEVEQLRVALKKIAHYEYRGGIAQRDSDTEISKPTASSIARRALEGREE